MIQAMNVDLSAYDPTLQGIPIKLEAGSLIERLRVSLDWEGATVDLGGNPLLSLGGKVAQLQWLDTPPMYVSAEVERTEPRAVNVTFSQSVKASGFRSGCYAQGEWKSRVIFRAVRQSEGNVVRYVIRTPVRHGDMVSWSYDTASGGISNWDGDHLLSVSPKIVPDN